MHWWLVLLPFISAVIGWLFNHLIIQMIFHPYKPKKILGFECQGFFPKHQPRLAKNAGKLVSTELFSFKEIEGKIAGPDSFKKIMPQVEQHIDHFLRVKLGKAMPMISMFIGDKTINQLKTIFVEELEQLFPEIMTSYMDKLQEDIDLEKMVAEKVAAVPVEKIEQFFLQALNKEIRTFKLAGAVSGFIIGLIQLLITLIAG